jgi:hypothetical protein
LEKKNKYINKGTKNVCDKLHDYEQNNITHYISLKLQNKDKYIIKIVDIPMNFDSTIIINHLTNITGKKVKSYNDHIKTPRLSFNQDQTQWPNRYNKSKYPKFKQIWVYFEDSKAIDYIFKHNIWNMSIESFIVRIISGNTKQEEYLKRTSFYYKISGLPLNMTIQDMVPLIKHLAGKTCTFNDQGRYSISKFAYIHVEEKNFKMKKQKTLFYKFTIFILPQHNDYTCNHCGSPNHRIVECKKEDFIQNGPHKIFKKRLIPRNTPNIIMDKSLNDEYKHVLQINRSIRSQKLQTTEQQNNQRNRGRLPTRENFSCDFKPQNYRSKLKGKRYSTIDTKQKQKERSFNDQTENNSQTFQLEQFCRQDTPINKEVQEFMTCSNKMFEAINNKIQELENSLNEQTIVNENLIKSINKTEEKHINLESAMEKMIT